MEIQYLNKELKDKDLKLNIIIGILEKNLDGHPDLMQKITGDIDCQVDDVSDGPDLFGDNAMDSDQENAIKKKILGKRKANASDDN